MRVMVNAIVSNTNDNFYDFRKPIRFSAPQTIISIYLGVSLTLQFVKSLKNIDNLHFCSLQYYSFGNLIYVLYNINNFR